MEHIPGKCRGCGDPVDPAYRWHAACLKAYRASADYRSLAIIRDGYDCARCFAWVNRGTAAFYAWRWAHTPHWLRHRVRQTRCVEVDHIDPLAGAGTHAQTNLQVLCRRHHKRKTRRDLAKLRSQPIAPAWLRPVVIAAVLLAITLGLWGPQADWRTWAVTGLVSLLGLRTLVHYRVINRLRISLAQQTGDSEGKLRTLRGRRWRWRRVDGLVLPRIRPTVITYAYPRTFADHDPNQQTALEARVASKCGGTWTAQWRTEADRVRLKSPDRLVSLDSIPWPNRNEPQLSLWQPIPVGIGEDGRTVSITLPGKNLLIGGEPESGKSVAQSMITATAALDPDVVMYGIDGKGLVELGDWRDSMEQLVGSGTGGVVAATKLLTDLRAIMDQRYDVLYREGRRKIEEGDGLSLHVLIIDELALFTAGGTRTQRDQFVEGLRDVISRGRAAGVITIAATQRPSADVVPTQVRDLIGYRWAMRCSTPQSSDMVLGQGQAALGFSAAKVPAAYRGIGLLLAEGALPVRLRAFRNTDAEIATMAERAARLRSHPGSHGEPATPAQAVGTPRLDSVGTLGASRSDEGTQGGPSVTRSGTSTLA